MDNLYLVLYDMFSNFYLHVSIQVHIDCFFDMIQCIFEKPQCMLMHFFYFVSTGYSKIAKMFAITYLFFLCIRN